jgi:DNA (cytosine-5)-methyltransferase 1
VENVPGLLNRGMGEVLGGLAACGYDAEWDTVSACEFQAPHTRERLLIVAYPSEKRCGWQRSFWTKETSLEIGRRGAELYRPWSVEPGIPRVAYGVPNRLDRIAGVGNSFIPQIAEYIARQIIKETQI